jgi:hypothetical protein
MAAIALSIPILMLGVLLALGWYEDGVLASSRSPGHHPEDPRGRLRPEGVAAPLAGGEKPAE